jgi:hypothetical protein
MKKTLTTLCLLGISVQGQCQYIVNRTKSSNLELMVRAKAIGMFIIEDLWFRNYSVGLELRYKEQFSFVADVVHFRWRSESEVYKDSSNTDYDEYNQWDARNYMAFETRYYPAFMSRSRSEDSFWRFYVTAQAKLGGQNIHSQGLYPHAENAIISSTGTRSMYGGGLGFQYGQPFGVDVNIGAALKYEVADQLIYHTNTEPTMLLNQKDESWIINMRVMLYFNLGTRHYLVNNR